MIKKEDLKDWLDESSRAENEKEIEEYIDKAIKHNVLMGEYTFDISTGRYTREGSRRTSFYRIWYKESLSDENQNVVHKRIIEKYRKAGFTVEESSVDCGWSNFYRSLKFKNVDKMFEEENK